MKTKHYLIFICFLSMQISLFAQFSLTPNPKDLGNIGYDEQVSFTLVATQNYTSFYDVTYTVELDEMNGEYDDWITHYGPNTFTLKYKDQKQVITFNGTYPHDWTIPTGQFIVKLYSNFNPNYPAYAIVKWVHYPDGIEDYIRITEYNDEFSELDNLYYEADFIDIEPKPDEITEWELNMRLNSEQGLYTYENITNDWSELWTYFQFQADQLPTNLSFVRNSEGNVLGSLEIRGHDSDGYDHFEDLPFVINKVPEKPFLCPNFLSNNSITLNYQNSGALNYKIYYDTDPGTPYNGTGLTQGNSPINAGTQTSFEISGMQECVPYYFSVVAENDEGQSDYSEERKISVFTLPNQLPITYFVFDQYVTSNQTFNENSYFAGDLIVESGAVVTFEGGIQSFNEGSKIIIEPGGKLILNGATCTAPCGQSWQGIEVWGNTNAHQFTIDGVNAQGQLVLQNGASIENAWNAVTLWKPDNWDMTGGIVVANNSTFKNNKRSVEFISYHNYHPIAEDRMQNLSSFTDCEFFVDEDFVIPSEFEGHITMFNVEGIKIEGCEFSNNIAASQNTGYGIYTLDAGYQISSYCGASISPCPPENITRTTFNNFYSGVSAGNSGSTNTIYVSDAEFHNNSYGVQLNAVDKATIIFNDFYVGPNMKDASICGLTYGIGIDINNSNGYAIEENEFYSANGMNGDDIGVRVNYNPDPENNIPDVDYNEIYLNYFDGIKIANTAEGQNLNLQTPFLGLNYLCNHNSNNGFDFYMTGIGIRLEQGDNEKPAGNTFSLNGNNPYSDINDQAVWNNIYHYNRDNYGEIPQYYNEKVYPIANSNSNTCASHYGGGNQQQATGMGLTTTQLQYFEQEFYDNRSDYNGTKALYESLIDGGNTPSAITDIETAWPDEMWVIRAELLAMSPHLSADVLMKTADRTDLFPDAVIYEIFSANPDALRDGKLIEYLETKENPLPTYMIDALQSGGGTITYKTILQSELAEYGEKMTNSANIIIRNMLNDSLTNNDTLQNWFERTGRMASDYQLIDNYLQNGNPATAISLVNNLPVEYSFEDADTTEYHFYKTLKQLQATILNGERNTFQLTAGEKSELESIADNSSSRAGTQAKNIMAFVYGNEYANCPRIPDPVTYKQSEASIYNFAENLLSLEAMPNPAKSWTAFNYSFPETVQNGIIQIRDTKGQLVSVIELEKAAGQVIWDTRKVIPGVYFFTLQADAYTKTGKLVVTQ